MALSLDGPQSELLSAAINSAADKPLVERMLRFRLKDDIANYEREKGGYVHLRFELIQAYNRRYQIDKLVRALLDYVPTNLPLLRFAWDHGIVSRPSGSHSSPNPSDNSLEQMLDPQRGLSDPVQFLQRFGRIINCVCRVTVETPDGPRNGTGFLTSDDTLLTNYHILEPVITKSPGVDRKSVRLLFDFHTAGDGQTISKGKEYKLIDDDSDWLVDYSPYADVDLPRRGIHSDIALSRSEDCLDYALLRVEGKPGAHPIVDDPASIGDTRGSVSLLNDGPVYNIDFEADAAAAFIFQHPEGRQLRLDWAKPAVLGVNSNATRVFYNLNTLKGSSGSPCFNARLELIALHHAGGKDWPAASDYLYNRGIPIDKIRRRLEKRNKLQIL